MCVRVRSISIIVEKCVQNTTTHISNLYRVSFLTVMFCFERAEKNGKLCKKHEHCNYTHEVLTKIAWPKTQTILTRLTCKLIRSKSRILSTNLVVWVGLLIHLILWARNWIWSPLPLPTWKWAKVIEISSLNTNFAASIHDFFWAISLEFLMKLSTSSCPSKTAVFFRAMLTHVQQIKYTCFTRKCDACVC